MRLKLYPILPNGRSVGAWGECIFANSQNGERGHTPPRRPVTHGTRSACHVQSACNTHGTGACAAGTGDKRHSIVPEAPQTAQSRVALEYRLTAHHRP
eukprot:2519863-Prymnesium_polylepis.1